MMTLLILRLAIKILSSMFDRKILTIKFIYD